MKTALRVRLQLRSALIFFGLLWLVEIGLQVAAGQVIAWDNDAGDKNWFTQNNWSSNFIPGTDADVMIGVGQTVVVPESVGVPAYNPTVRLKSLIVDTNSQLEIENSDRFGFLGTNLNSSLINRGTITAGDNADITLSNNFENVGTTSLNGARATVESNLSTTSSTRFFGGGKLELSGDALIDLKGFLRNINHTISGSGTIDGLKAASTTTNNLSGFDNQVGGVISANLAGESLNVSVDQVINRGLLDADSGILSFKTKNFDNRDGGVIRASDGGQVSFQGTSHLGLFSNAGGVVEATDGSSVNFYNLSSVSGGTIRSSGTGAIRIKKSPELGPNISSSAFANLKLEGDVTVENGAILSVRGLESTNLIHVLAGGELGFFSFNSSTADPFSTMAGNRFRIGEEGIGGGRILLDGRVATMNGQLKGFGENKSNLSPNVGAFNVSASGEITADVSGETYKTNIAENQGLLQASNGGRLQIGDVVTNSQSFLGVQFGSARGSVVAQNESTVAIYDASMSRQDLKTETTGVMEISRSNSQSANTLDNEGTTRLLNSAIVIQTTGEFSHSGLIDVVSDAGPIASFNSVYGVASFVSESNEFKMSGGGTIRLRSLDDPSAASIPFGESVLRATVQGPTNNRRFVVSDQTIEGAGGIDSGGAVFIIEEKGSVIANVAGQMLSFGLLSTNLADQKKGLIVDGTLKATNGGILGIYGFPATSQPYGQFSLVAGNQKLVAEADSGIDFNHSLYLQGTTLESVEGGNFLFRKSPTPTFGLGKSTQLENITNLGSVYFEVPTTGFERIGLRKTFDNQGIVMPTAIANGTRDLISTDRGIRFEILEDTTLTGGGTIDLGGKFEGRFSTSTASSGSKLIIEDQRIIGSGTFGNHLSTSLNIVIEIGKSGIIEATRGGFSIRVNEFSDLDQYGTLIASRSISEITGSFLDNAIIVSEWSQAPSFFVNHGTIELHDSTGQMESGSTSLRPTFSVDGKGILNASDGLISGHGLISFNEMENAGTLSAGVVPLEVGRLELGGAGNGFGGDVKLLETSKLIFDIGTTGSDLYMLTGLSEDKQLTLDGELLINLLADYIPDANDRFTVFGFIGGLSSTGENQIFGAFSNGMRIDNGTIGKIFTADGTGQFNIFYDSSEVYLSNFHVVSIPEPAMHFVFAAASICGLLKRRRNARR